MAVMQLCAGPIASLPFRNKRMEGSNVRNKTDYQDPSNSHISQKLCWQHGIITASLRNLLQMEHLSSDGKEAFLSAKS